MKLTIAPLATFTLLITLSPLAAQEVPDITDGFTPAEIAPGSPFGSFPLSGFESVSYYSGKLSVAVPLLPVGGRGEAGYTMTLGEVTPQWIVDQEACLDHDPNPCQTPVRSGWSGKSPGFSPGVLVGRQTTHVLVGPNCSSGSSDVTQQSITRLTFIMPDRSEIELRDATTSGETNTTTHSCSGSAQPSEYERDTTFRSADGSAITFVASAMVSDLEGNFGAMDQTNGESQTFTASLLNLDGTLYFPNGIKYLVVDGLVEEIRDRNGNQITFDYTAGGVEDFTAVDSLGRTITVQPFGNDTQVSYPGYLGANRTITVRRASLSTRLVSGSTQTFGQLFPATDLDLAAAKAAEVFNPLVVSEVELPGGIAKYGFRYNQFSEVAEVALPSGGTIDYTWDTGVTTASGAIEVGVAGEPDTRIIRVVTTREVRPDGVNLEQRQLISRSVTSGAGCAIAPAGTPASTLDSTAVTIETRDSGSNLAAKEKRYFCGNVEAAGTGATTGPLGWSIWKNGREFLTERFATNGSSILRSTVNTWSSAIPSCNRYMSGSHAGGPPTTTALHLRIRGWLQSR